MSEFFDWIPDLNTVAAITVTTSVICSIITILTYVLFPSKRRFPVRLPLYMVFAGLGISLAMLIGVLQGPCYLQSIGMYYFGTACWIWWSVISYNFYDVIIRSNTSAVQTREKLYNLIAWPLSFLFLIVAMLWGRLEEKRLGTFWECFVAEKPIESQYILFYGWLGLISFIALFVWPRCLLKLYRIHVYHSGSRTESLKLLAYGRHMFFMIIFFIYFIILLTFRIQFHVNGMSYTLAMLHTFFVSSIGLWLFFIFAISKQNISLWVRFIKTGRRDEVQDLGDFEGNDSSLLASGEADMNMMMDDNMAMDGMDGNEQYYDMMNGGVNAHGMGDNMGMSSMSYDRNHENGYGQMSLLQMHSHRTHGHNVGVYNDFRSNGAVGYDQENVSYGDLAGASNLNAMGLHSMSDMGDMDPNADYGLSGDYSNDALSEGSDAGHYVANQYQEDDNRL